MISSDGRNRNTSGESIQSASQMSLSDDIVDRVRRALLLLNQAACYAADVQADSWDFAVPIAELTDIGLAANDIRWLVTKGYLENRNEVREPDNGSREFVETGQFLLDKRTTFTITNSGRAFLAACNNETGALPVVEGQELNGSSGLA